MRKWEYKSFPEIDANDAVKELNIAGRDGWELVGFSMFSYRGNIYREYILKKEIE